MKNEMETNSKRAEQREVLVLTSQNNNWKKKN